MEVATYSPSNANSICAAYERAAKSIFALGHTYRGFCDGVTACVPNPDPLIAEQREFTATRQAEIQDRMGELYYSLLDVDPARAHKLPEIPRTIVQLEARRAKDVRRAAKSESYVRG
jgi:hypothetical protein